MVRGKENGVSQNTLLMISAVMSCLYLCYVHWWGPYSEGGQASAPGGSIMKRIQGPQENRDREDHSGPGYPGGGISVCTEGNE